jgi:hypothetical protein
LIQYLEAIAQSGTDRAKSGKELLESWQAGGNSVNNGERPTRVSTFDLWQSLATLPGSSQLFVARDDAARERLAKIGGPLNAGPLPELLREQLEKAIAAGDRERGQKLLALDNAAAVLTETEHRDWEQTLALLEKAAACLEQKNSAEARTCLLTVLRSPVSAAAGQHAARTLRQLPPPR